MFLTDAQTDQRFVDMLRRLAWDVRTVHEEGMSNEKLDYLVAARARCKRIRGLDVDDDPREQRQRYNHDLFASCHHSSDYSYRLWHSFRAYQTYSLH